MQRAKKSTLLLSAVLITYSYKPPLFPLTAAGRLIASTAQTTLPRHFLGTEKSGLTCGVLLTGKQPWGVGGRGEEELGRLQPGKQPILTLGFLASWASLNYE